MPNKSIPWSGGRRFCGLLTSQRNVLKKGELPLPFIQQLLVFFRFASVASPFILRNELDEIAILCWEHVMDPLRRKSDREVGMDSVTDRSSAYNEHLNAFQDTALTGRKGSESGWSSIGHCSESLEQLVTLG